MEEAGEEAEEVEEVEEAEEAEEVEEAKGEVEETTLVHQLQGPPDQSNPAPRVQIPGLPFPPSHPGPHSHNRHWVVVVAVATAVTPTVTPSCVIAVRMPSS